MSRAGRAVRPVVLALALSCLGSLAFAADMAGRDLKLPAKERMVSVTLFRAGGDAPRPSVLMLHGAGGFNRRIADYKHYASSLAQMGVDAYLVFYYSDADDRSMKAGNDVFETRYTAWAKLVDDLADGLLKQKDSNGHVGLIGFSNGAILAAGASALDPKIDAAVIYYGAEPWPIQTAITHWPPLLILHGDADQIIPVSAGRDLAAAARKVGAPVDLVIYPGEGHGFAATPGNPNAADGLKRTEAFLQQHLK